jgi:hypothetical protein
MGQAKRRQAEIEQLKARGPKPKAQTPHSTDKKSGIISYYWGYRADEGDQGFEFSTMTLTGMGMDYATALSICAVVKKSSDYQLRLLEAGETQQRFNLSREEFIEEEHHRMLGTVAWLNQFVRDRGTFIPPLMNIYMNLSPTMRTFDTAVNADFGAVEETAILVTIDDIYLEKKERHLDF